MRYNMYTSVSLHPRTIFFLKKAACNNSIRSSSLIRICLFYWFKTHRSRTRILEGTVKYQHSDGIKYKRIHVSFSRFEYESLLDSRKLRKRSVSSIATEAIFEFANKINTNGVHCLVDLDNYFFPLYQINKKTYKEHIIWNIAWGHKPEINKREASKERKT